MNTSVYIDGNSITDWDSFHSVFAEVFGFPGFYGNNMNAWIDCMTRLDAPVDEMTNVHVAPGGIMSIVVRDAANLKARCPDQFNALIECSAFVNYRRMELADPPILGLVLIGYF